MQRTTSVLLVTLAVLATASAQVPFLTTCPEMDVVHNFNVSAYLGKWYEQMRYFAIFELGGSCVTATYTDEGNGVVGVENKMTVLPTRKKMTIKGTATLQDSTGDAKLNVRFSTVGNFDAPYWILATDYNNYAIVWSCNKILASSVQFAWILTREKNPGLEVLTEIKEQTQKHNLPSGLFLKTQQICEDN